MCHTNNEKGKMANDVRNRTTKSRKNQNTRRKGNLQILGNIRSGDERKNKKEYPRRTRKLLETRLLETKLYR